MTGKSALDADRMTQIADSRRQSPAESAGEAGCGGRFRRADRSEAVTEGHSRDPRDFLRGAAPFPGTACRREPLTEFKKELFWATPGAGIVILRTFRQSRHRRAGNPPLRAANAKRRELANGSTWIRRPTRRLRGGAALRIAPPFKSDDRELRRPTHLAGRRMSKALRISASASGGIAFGWWVARISRARAAAPTLMSGQPSSSHSAIGRRSANSG